MKTQFLSLTVMCLLVAAMTSPAHAEQRVYFSRSSQVESVEKSDVRVIRPRPIVYNKPAQAKQRITIKHSQPQYTVERHRAADVSKRQQQRAYDLQQQRNAAFKRSAAIASSYTSIAPRDSRLIAGSVYYRTDPPRYHHRSNHRDSFRGYRYQSYYPQRWGYSRPYAGPVYYQPYCSPRLYHRGHHHRSHSGVNISIDLRF